LTFAEGVERSPRKTRRLPDALRLPHMPPIVRGDRRVDRLDDPDSPQIQPHGAANRVRIAIPSLVEVTNHRLKGGGYE